MRVWNLFSSLNFSSEWQHCLEVAFALPSQPFRVRIFWELVKSTLNNKIITFIIGVPLKGVSRRCIPSNDVKVQQVSILGVTGGGSKLDRGYRVQVRPSKMFQSELCQSGKWHFTLKRQISLNIFPNCQFNRPRAARLQGLNRVSSLIIVKEE